jgi:hypothetical protein
VGLIVVFNIDGFIVESVKIGQSAIIKSVKIGQSAIINGWMFLL